MTGDTRSEVLLGFFRSIFRAVFVTYFYLTLVVIGLTASLAPAVFRTTPDQSESAMALLVRTLGHMGEAILVAGVVTTFMRFFASLDIVGEKIQGWLTNEGFLEKLSSKTSDAVGARMAGWLTDDKYLEKVANQSALALYEPHRALNNEGLRTVWQNISLAMTRHAFPQIAAKVYSKTLDQLMKASEEYYLEFYERVTTLEADSSDSDIVGIHHKLGLQVVANQNNANTKFSARFLLDEFSDKKLDVEYFRANGKDRPIVLEKSAGDRPGVDQYVLETDIPAGKALRIDLSYRLRQSLVHDPFILWTTTRYVLQARHEINFPKGVACTYQDATIAALLEKDSASMVKPPGQGGRLVYVSRPEELLFPGSAFIFMLRKEKVSS